MKATPNNSSARKKRGKPSGVNCVVLPKVKKEPEAPLLYWRFRLFLRAAALLAALVFNSCLMV